MGQPADSSLCGTDFTIGEEKTFVASEGAVNSCGQLYPDGRLLELFRGFGNNMGLTLVRADVISPH
jgi:hypothetical protein